MAEGDAENPTAPAARPAARPVPGRRPPPRPPVRPANPPRSQLPGPQPVAPVAAAEPPPPPAPPPAAPPAPSRVEQLAAESVPVQGSISADISLVIPAEKDFDKDSYEREVERIRGLRKPFGQYTLKLALPVRRGYKRHWFNAVPGRIEQKLAEGWAHVTDREGKPIKRVVGTGRDNNALLGYAMEIPVVFWLEGQDETNKIAQAKMDDIRTNPVRAKPGTSNKADAGKFYSPTEEGMVQIREDPVPTSQF